MAIRRTRSRSCARRWTDAVTRARGRRGCRHNCGVPPCRACRNGTSALPPGKAPSAQAHAAASDGAAPCGAQGSSGALALQPWPRLSTAQPDHEWLAPRVAGDPRGRWRGCVKRWADRAAAPAPGPAPRGESKSRRGPGGRPGSPGDTAAGRVCRSLHTPVILLTDAAAVRQQGDAGALRCTENAPKVMQSGGPPCRRRGVKEGKYVFPVALQRRQACSACLRSAPGSSSKPASHGVTSWAPVLIAEGEISRQISGGGALCGHNYGAVRFRADRARASPLHARCLRREPTPMANHHSRRCNYP